MDFVRSGSIDLSGLLSFVATYFSLYLCCAFGFIRDRSGWSAGFVAIFNKVYAVLIFYLWGGGSTDARLLASVPQYIDQVQFPLGSDGYSSSGLSEVSP